jgi:hypothetical protein
MAIAKLLTLICDSTDEKLNAPSEVSTSAAKLSKYAQANGWLVLNMGAKTYHLSPSVVADPAGVGSFLSAQASAQTEISADSLLDGDFDPDEDEDDLAA